MYPNDPEFEENMRQIAKTLPNPIRTYLASGKYSSVTQMLMGKYSLHIDQSGILERELLLMLMGLETPDEFETALKNELQLPEGVILQIMDDVNQEVFVPLRKEIREISAADEVNGTSAARKQSHAAVPAVPSYQPPRPPMPPSVSLPPQQQVPSAEHGVPPVVPRLAVPSPAPARGPIAFNTVPPTQASVVAKVSPPAPAPAPLPNPAHMAHEVVSAPLPPRAAMPHAARAAVQGAPRLAPSFSGASVPAAPPPPINLPGAIEPKAPVAPPPPAEGGAYPADPYREPIE